MRGGDRGPGGRKRTLLPVLLLLAAAGLPERAACQEEQYFEEPRRLRVTFRWDAFARYDLITGLNRADVERGRFEVRPEVALELSDRFKIAARAIGSLGTDENRDNAPNFDNYRSDGAALERYYVEARPGSWTLRVGSFGLPLLATEMLWDHDVQTPGGAVSYAASTGTSVIALTAAAFYGPQREGDRTRIGVGQVRWSREPAPLGWEAALSFWNFGLDDLKPRYVRQNRFVLRRGVRTHASDFAIADALFRVRYTGFRVPLQVSVDGARNFGAATDERDAFEASLAVGQLGTPGQWRFFYTFQYVERDAVLGAYNTDDWWFHSWYRGHRAGLGVTFLPRVFVQGTFMVQQRLDLPNSLNRYTIDLVKMF